MNGLAELQSERDQVYNTQADAQSRQGDLQEQISRLQSAEDQLKDAKDQLKIIKNRASSLEDKTEGWSGKQFERYYNDYLPNMMDEYEEYHAYLDTVLDRVCDKKTQLENQLLETEGILGWCAARLNDLGNAIWKLLN